VILYHDNHYQTGIKAYREHWLKILKTEADLMLRSKSVHNGFD
jgi:hypothetical protein